MAKAPETWVDWADFFSKTVIAVAGVAISATTLVLGTAEKRRADAAKQTEIAAARTQETQRRAIEQKADQERAARDKREQGRDDTAQLLDHLPADMRERLGIKIVVDYCNGAPPARTGVGMDVSLCRSLATLGDQRLVQTATVATQTAQAAVAQRDPKAFLNSRAAVAQNTGMAAAEAVRPAASGRWFAVVGTLPQTSPDAVRSLAAQLNARLLGAGLPNNDVHVYRTQISKSFALTSGVDKSEADARARARMLRNAGFADAFAQPDRGWERADGLR